MDECRCFVRVSAPLGQRMIKQNRLAYLDGWRGLAIALVLTGHFGPWEGLGSVGVDVFFVLSGRLMADILFIERYPLPIFFQRRLSRIVPGLLAFIASMILLSTAGMRLAHAPPVLTWRDTIAALTFTTNYGAALFGMNSILVHTWSLAVEEHSYIVLGGFAFFLRDRRSAATALLFALSALCMANGLFQASTYVGHDLLHHIYWRTDVRAASVFLSAAVRLATKDRPISPLAPLAALGIGLPLELMSAPIALTIGTMALSVSVNTLDASALLRRGLALKPLAQLGIYSFSIYLWQQPFYAAHFKRLPTLVALAGAIIAGLASFYAIENPARRLLNERFLHLRARVPNRRTLEAA